MLLLSANGAAVHKYEGRFREHVLGAVTEGFEETAVQVKRLRSG